jgi:rRNA processing protein Gar1
MDTSHDNIDMIQQPNPSIFVASEPSAALKDDVNPVIPDFYPNTAPETTKTIQEMQKAQENLNSLPDHIPTIIDKSDAEISTTNKAELREIKISPDSSMAGAAEPLDSTVYDEEGAAVAEPDSDPYTSSESDMSESEPEEPQFPLTGDRLLDSNYLRKVLGESAAFEQESEDEDLAAMGSDEEEGDFSASAPPKTANEILSAPPIQQFTVSPSDSIIFAGKIHSIIQDTELPMVVVQANSSQSRALDAGSALCTENREAVGRIDEIFGPVSEPFYSLRVVPNCDLKNLAENQRVYYIPSLSSFVLADTAPGSDASNLHDEEVEAENQEFSDDEKEAQAKANKKQSKRNRGKQNNSHNDNFHLPTQAAQLNSNKFSSNNNNINTNNNNRNGKNANNVNNGIVQPSARAFGQEQQFGGAGLNSNNNSSSSNNSFQSVPFNPFQPVSNPTQSSSAYNPFAPVNNSSFNAPAANNAPANSTQFNPFFAPPNTSK